jgi:hypothetical protein
MEFYASNAINPQSQKGTKDFNMSLNGFIVLGEEHGP